MGTHTKRDSKISNVWVFQNRYLHSIMYTNSNRRSKFLNGLICIYTKFIYMLNIFYYIIISLYVCMMMCSIYIFFFKNSSSRRRLTQQQQECSVCVLRDIIIIMIIQQFPIIITVIIIAEHCSSISTPVVSVLYCSNNG